MKEMGVNTGEIGAGAGDEVDEVKKLIQTTFHDIIQHDKKELMELLAKLKLAELIEEKPIFPTIDELIKYSTVTQSAKDVDV